MMPVDPPGGGPGSGGGTASSTPERVRKAPPIPERASQQAEEEHRLELQRWMEQAAGLQVSPHQLAFEKVQQQHV